MKKFLVVFMTIGFAFCAADFVQAQSIKKYSGKKSVSMPGVYRSLDCQESYEYYIGENGDYVKSGVYTLKGVASKIAGEANASYNVVATYKNGLLNGHLTAKLTVKGRGNYNYTFHSYDQFNIEYTLSANFRDGVPDGQWNYSETGLLNEDKNIYNTSFTCKNGKFIGDFNCNFSDLTLPKHQQGRFDQNGNLMSLKMQGNALGRMGDSFKGEDDGLKEFNLNSNGDLVSYFKRDKNNKTIHSYKLDENLQKEYEKQLKSDLIVFLKEKECYLSRETSNRKIFYDSYDFSTEAIVDHILQRMALKHLDGLKKSEGLFDKLSANECIYKKNNVFPLTEKQFLTILNGVRSDFETYYKNYDKLIDNTAVISESLKKSITKKQNVYFVSINDTLYYFENPQYKQLKERVNNVWNVVDDSIKAEKVKMILQIKKDFPEFAETQTKNIMKDVMACYGRFSEYGSVSYNNSISNLMHQLYQLTGHSISGDDIGQKFASYKPILSYSIDDITLNKDYDKCIVYLTVNSDYYSHRNKPVHWCVWYDRLYQGDVTNTQYIILRWDESFKNTYRVAPIWDSIAELKKNAMQLDNQVKSYKNEYPKIVSNYNKEKIIFKNNNDAAAKTQYSYYSKALLTQKCYLQLIDLMKQFNERAQNIMLSTTESDITKSYQEISKTLNLSGSITDNIKRYEDALSFQNHCMNFIAKRKTISDKTAEINTNSGKDYSDISKSFANFKKTYNLILSADTNDNHTRLNNYLNIQDSCLKFIELRKTITQNNTKIAGFSKSAPTIVKAYNMYMKGVYLAWNPELGRNQTVREIINTQDTLLKALSQPNISEIDKSVKKSKAKSWEEVRKIVLQHQ